jgi:restriction system protein
MIAVAARLPWWACLALAVVSYLALHAVASKPLAVSAQPSQLQGFVIGSVLRALAMVGQYLLPIVFIAGGVMSLVARHARHALAEQVMSNAAAEALNGMTWQQFEQLVGEAFRLQGYAVVETGGGGADGGVDLVLRKGSEKHLVQCKQWRAFKVGVDVVRELYGVMAARGASGGFVVTSGSFTDEAARFANGRNVWLMDGPKLLGLLKQARAARGESTLREVKEPLPTTTPQPMVSAPTCRRCAKPMIKRLARRGPNAGHEFWGCTGYPACKETSAVR